MMLHLTHATLLILHLTHAALLILHLIHAALLILHLTHAALLILHLTHAGGELTQNKREYACQWKFPPHEFQTVAIYVDVSPPPY